MSQKFHQRFNIEVSLPETRRRFVNRVHSDIWDDYIYNFSPSRNDRYESSKHIMRILGDKYISDVPLARQIGDNYERNLLAIEAFYQSLSSDRAGSLNAIISILLSLSEIDLGVRWEKGQFIPAGAPLLDEKAVNDVLGLIDAAEYKGVDQAFRKGLDLFLHSTKKPDLLSDVVTRMYEALEAMAKVVCSNDKDLSANREAFLSKLKLSDAYKRMLKEYIEYANDLHRHAGEMGQPKPLPSRREVEAFVYLTGLVIRLALSQET